MADRTCMDCGTDISGLHGNARRCSECRAKISPPSNRACSNGDDRPAVAHDLCGACYAYAVRHNGSFERLTPEERFWAKINQNGPVPEHRPALGPCWVWTDVPASTGYGFLYVNRRKVLAHRFSYRLIVGPIPGKLQLDHLCRNRACVRPSHLEPVTNRINALRGDGPRLTSARGRAKTHCKWGHSFDKRNTYWHEGRRHCKKCTERRWRARQEQQKVARHARGLKVRRATIPGMCSRDLHLMAGDNVYADPTTGRERCKTCRRDDAREARRRAA